MHVCCLLLCLNTRVTVHITERPGYLRKCLQPYMWGYGGQGGDTERVEQQLSKLGRQLWRRSSSAAVSQVNSVILYIAVLESLHMLWIERAHWFLWKPCSYQFLFQATPNRLRCDLCKAKGRAWTDGAIQSSKDPCIHQYPAERHRFMFSRSCCQVRPVEIMGLWKWVLLTLVLVLLIFFDFAASLSFLQSGTFKDSRRFKDSRHKYALLS